jgi:hypothetical protein
VITITDGVTTANPVQVLDYTYTRAARTIVHEVLDRPDPDITLRPVGYRAGTLGLFFPDRATALAAEDMHRIPGVLHLDADADEATATMDYVPTGVIAVTLDLTGQRRWRVDVQYQEVQP